MGIATGARGKQKLEIVRLHRLLEFETTFSSYLEGKASAQQVKYRGDWMLKVGLPRLK
jgi:hypothetical protein